MSRTSSDPCAAPPRRGGRRWLSQALFFWLAATSLSAQFFDLPPQPEPWQFGNLTIDRLSSEHGGEPVLFSHWVHRRFFTCRVCHFELGFVMERNATEITETANRAGDYCGACHDGTTAFAIEPGSCGRCHGAKEKTLKKAFKKLGELPAAPFGNGIDWNEAIAQSGIAPRQSLFEKDFEPLHFEAESFEIEADWILIPPAEFSHEKHLLWHDCGDCHPDLFNIKKKTTEKFDMSENLEGRFCGACHRNVAFPMDDCQRCHPGIRMRTPR